VIDEIKSHLEHACPATVSCADILALASRDAVSLLGGPAWNVQLGRKDSRGADRDAAANNLPSPHANRTSLIAAFAEHGLDARDMAALSGAHCRLGAVHPVQGPRVRPGGGWRRRHRPLLRGAPPADVPGQRRRCRGAVRRANTDGFDNAYYKELVARRGLLTSDQELYGL
jgi:peroxidase